MAQQKRSQAGSRKGAAAKKKAASPATGQKASRVPAERRTAQARAASVRTTRMSTQARGAVEVREPLDARSVAAHEADGRTRHDISGVVIGVVGVALLVSVLTPSTGVLTRAVSDALHAVLGLGAFLVPAALIFWSLSFFLPSQRLVPARMAGGLGLVALAIICILGITTPGASVDPSILFNPFVLADRGGYVGNGVAWALLRLTGVVVGIVVLSGVAAGGLVLVGFSASDALLGLRLRLREHRELARRDAQERAAQAARLQQQEWLEDEYADDDYPDGYAPTALFDPDRPLAQEQATTRRLYSDIPDARATSRPRTVRTFGCGNAPMGMDEDYQAQDPGAGRRPSSRPLSGRAPSGAVPTSVLDSTPGYAGVSYLPRQGSPEDGASFAFAAGQVGWAQGDRNRADGWQDAADASSDAPYPAYPQHGEEPMGSWAGDDQGAGSVIGSGDAGFPGVTDLSGGLVTPPLRRGIDVPFDDMARPGMRDRARARREESLSRAWWEEGGAPGPVPNDHEPATPLDFDIPGLAVPGIIDGAPNQVSADASRPQDAARSSIEPDLVDTESQHPGLGQPFEAAAWGSAEARDTGGADELAGSQDVSRPDSAASVKNDECSGGADDVEPEEDLAPDALAANAPVSVARRFHGEAASRPLPTPRREVLPWDDAPDAGDEDDAPDSIGRADRDDLPQRMQGSLSPDDAAVPTTDGPYRFPSADRLRHNPGGLQKTPKEREEIREMADLLAQTLGEFKVSARVVGWIEGPTCTTYEVEPGEGVRVNKFTSLEEDISRSLARESVRIYSPVHGTPYIGIEVPNTTRQTVYFGDVLPNATGGPLDVTVGIDADGKPVTVDIAKLPHLLIAGTTGSGKSVMVNSIICSMLMRDTPDEVRMIMVDPKQVELTGYNGIPHLVMPVVSDPRQAAAALQWGVTEMDRRYRVFSRLSVRQITKYNEHVEREERQTQGQTPLKKLPYLVIIIDELTDLMMVAKKDVEASIVRIAQLGRAAGIHLVLATQRPSADVVTGLIKANVGNRMGLKVATGVDSKVVLDQTGAEKLLGRGDMLFLQTVWGDKPRRIQGCYLSDPEIADIVDQLKENPVQVSDCGMAPVGSSTQLSMDDQLGMQPADSEGAGSASDDDPLAYKAAVLVVENQMGSTSMIQRRLKLGYARAGRVMDMLEEMGVVGPQQNGKPRDVLVRDLDELSNLLGTDVSEEEF